jgi:hypothetical protein
MLTFCLAERYEQIQEAVSLGFDSVRFIIPGYTRITSRSFRASIAWDDIVGRYILSAPPNATITPTVHNNTHIMIHVGTVSYYIPLLLMSKNATSHILPLSSQSASVRKRLIETGVAMRLLLAKDTWVLQSLADASHLQRMEADMERQRVATLNARLVLFHCATGVCCVCFRHAPRVASLRCGHKVACVGCMCKTEYGCILCNMH